MTLNKVYTSISIGILLVFSLGACVQLRTLQLEKSAHSLTSDYSVEVPPSYQRAYGTSRVGVKVHFPGESYRDSLRLEFKVQLDPDNPLNSVARISQTSPFIIDDIEYRHGQYTVILSWKKHVQSETPFYKSPNHSLKNLSDLALSVGNMQKRTGGLWVFSSHTNCTAFVVGPTLVMTNNHCIKNQRDCENAKFIFWNANERTRFLQRTVTRDYQCSRLLATSEDHDYSLVRVHGNPSQHYPPLSFVKNPLLLKRHTPIHIISNNPPGEKRLTSCLSEDQNHDVPVRGRHKSVKTSTGLRCFPATISGDSGSPAFNNHGDVMGIVWGSNGNGQRGEDLISTTLITPMWLIYERHKQLFDALPINWVER